MLITEDIRLLTTIPERIKTVVDWFRISLVFEFEKDGGFSVRQPDDPGNVLRGSYTLVGEAGIEILLEGGEERFSGTYAIASGELVLILSGERQYFSRYRG